MPSGPLNLKREHVDPFADDATPFVTDRQRVVRCSAFRRLQRKTQVFAPDAGDHNRTRLTHTLEVSLLARRLADALNLNSDLAEVVALAHDLGHPPFGHAGEKALAECMRDHGGFEHNSHALRVVEHIEHPYPEFRGLNLTHVARECLAKHETPYDAPGPHPLQDGSPPPGEGEVVDLADQIAYALHDLQDGLYGGVDPATLKDIALWREAYDGPAPEDGAWRGHLQPTIDRMQQFLVSDAVKESLPRLRTGQRRDKRLVRLSPVVEKQLDELQRFLHERLYRTEAIQASDARGRTAIVTLFNTLVADPAPLGKRFADRIEREGVHRIVADYIAGMTDPFCLAQIQHLQA